MSEQPSTDVHYIDSPEKFAQVRVCCILSGSEEKEGGPTPVAAVAAGSRARLWDAGETIKIQFLRGGAPALREKLRRTAHLWVYYANVNFDWVDAGRADVRIEINGSGVSNSYIGTDCRSIPEDKPTMVFGWLDDNSSDEEITRVVLHEFGHALGLLHEHQNPSGKIVWDYDAAYKYFRHRFGSLTDAEYEDVLQRNVISPANSTNFSAFDRSSIMLYSMDDISSLGITTHNITLSDMDKTFVATQLYPGRPYAFWKLRVGTILHEVDDTFEFALAPNRDLFCIKKSGTLSQSTEVYILSAASNYQAFSMRTATGLHVTGSTDTFALAENRDLFYIKKSGGASGTTEIHVLSAASNYKDFILQTHTRLHQTYDTFEFALASNRDLFCIKKSATDSTSTEVHVLSAALDYQDFSLQSGTSLHETGSTDTFVVAHNRDLVYIKKSNTGTKTTEVHVLSSASNYQDFVMQKASILPETDATVDFCMTSDDERLLFCIKKSRDDREPTEVCVM